MGNELNLSMFRAYDIRTPSDLLTTDLAERLVRAEAKYFRDDLGVSTVLVAHEARRTGPHYLALGIEAFLDAGLDIIYLPGVCSTPYFYFAAMCNPGAAAIMFGASHNPASDTGQKVLAPGVAPVAAGIGPLGGLSRIKALYIAAESAHSKNRGRIRSAELMDDYIAYSMDLAGIEHGGLDGLRIFADILNGAAGREMLATFHRAGAEFTPLHFVPDGYFPLGDPNPIKRAVIRQGIQTLQDGDFHLAFFLDGDGDRLDIYRGDTTYLSSSFVYAAILPYICESNSNSNPSVFADLKSNPTAIIEMAKAGVSVDVIRNGHSQIKQSLIDSPAHFGAVEESAHFYQAFVAPDGNRYCTENTLYTALLVARLLRDSPRRFDELVELQSKTAREREWGYKFRTQRQQTDALDAVRCRFESNGMKSLNKMKNGMPLEATLLRRGLPFDVNQNTRLSEDWIQICQRVSQSETGLTRWEVVGDNSTVVQEAKRTISQTVRQFGAGEEYQG